MATTTSVRKRKRDEAEGDRLGTQQVGFATYDKRSADVGPVLVNFPAVRPPDEAPFSVYAKKDSKDEQQDFASKTLFIAGETDTVEFHSTRDADVARRGCQYLIGVRDKKTNIITLRPTPMHVLATRVKAFKDSTTDGASHQATERITQRNLLGETFGTKKAQKAIRAAERRKIDVTAVEGVTGHIQDSIGRNTESLPTQDDAKAISDSSRHIPPYDANAVTLEDIYKLHDIIPESELNAISLTDILATEDAKQRNSCIPKTRSEWVRQHLSSIMSTPNSNKKQLKIVLYVAALMAFCVSGFRTIYNREGLEQCLQGMPLAVIDGILSRFTECPRGSTSPKFTTNNQIKIMSYMCALCLHVDGFATDTALIASDLSESVPKINQYFKQLGCKIRKLSATEIANAGLSAAAAEHKRAVLRLPLEFPKPKLKRNR